MVFYEELTGIHRLRVRRATHCAMQPLNTSVGHEVA